MVLVLTLKYLLCLKEKYSFRMSYLMTDCCDLKFWFCVLLQDDSDLAKTQIKHKMSATKIQSFEFSRDRVVKNRSDPKIPSPQNCIAHLD